MDKLRPVYIAQKQLRSVGAARETFQFEWKVVDGICYALSRCPHSFRLKKEKTYTSAAFDVDTKTNKVTKVRSARCNGCKGGHANGKCWHFAALCQVLEHELLLENEDEDAVENPSSSTEGSNKWKRLRRARNLKMSIRVPIEAMDSEAKQKPRVGRNFEYRDDVSEDDLKEIRATWVRLSLLARKTTAFATAYENEITGDTKPHTYNLQELADGSNIKPRMFHKERKQN